MDQPVLSSIKPEKMNFGAFFLQTQLDTHFIFCRSITQLVSAVIEMLPPLEDFHQYRLEQINYPNVKNRKYNASYETRTLRSL